MQARVQEDATGFNANYGRWVLSTICALLFAMPLGIGLLYGADYLDLANEPLAYRYFFCVRIAAGETVVVGVGWLLGLFQQILYPLFGDTDSLRESVQGFALATNTGIWIGACILLIIATRDSRLQASDRWLLYMVILVPVFATHGTGFDYMVMGDYHTLNLLLVALTVYLFLVEWRHDGTLRSWRRVAALGLVLGAMVANKVTLLAVGIAFLIPVLIRHPIGSRMAKLVVVGALSSLLGFLFVIAATFRFNLFRVGKALDIWLAFVLNPGGESDFWSENFRIFLLEHGYLSVVVIFGLALLALLVSGRASDWTRDRVFVVLAALFAAFAALGFVIKRPAGSTIFESFVFLLAWSAMLISVLPESRWKKVFIRSTCAMWLVFSLSTFDAGVIEMVRGSRERASAKWSHYEQVRALAQGSKITVVFPDNSYHHEGVFELLLKGAVDFPTWQISDGGRGMLDEFSPGLVFRHEYGGVAPGEPFLEGGVVVWYDTPDSQPLVDRYAVLSRLVEAADQSESLQSWTLHGKIPGSRVFASAIRVAPLNASNP
ncbi:MAG: hypothetical protein GY725_00080 [bacterium]|nr:hypothetical protein [bacterium]